MALDRGSLARLLPYTHYLHPQTKINFVHEKDFVYGQENAKIEEFELAFTLRSTLPVTSERE